MTTEYAARYTNTVLYDDAGQKHLGDFLIHDNGAWSVSNGDEDVRYVIDGSDKLLHTLVTKLAYSLSHAT